MSFVSDFNRFFYTYLLVFSIKCHWHCGVGPFHFSTYLECLHPTQGALEENPPVRCHLNIRFPERFVCKYNKFFYFGLNIWVTLQKEKEWTLQLLLDLPGNVSFCTRLKENTFLLKILILKKCCYLYGLRICPSKCYFYHPKRSYSMDCPLVITQEIRIDLLALEKLWEVLDEWYVVKNPQEHLQTIF